MFYEKTKLMVLLVFVCVSSFVVSATAAPNNALGVKVFQTHCAACHDGGNNVVESEKTLKADALKKFGFNGVADIKKRVQDGKSVMPIFSDRLKPDEIDAVSNYVWEQSQKGWK